MALFDSKSPPDKTDKPVGQGNYVVRPGDCISSIAVGHGHFWQTIWNHSANADLQRIRKDPNVLLPGDRVTIPEIRQKETSCDTDKRHRFRKRGEPSKLKLEFQEFGEPRAGEPFRIDVDGRTIKESTLNSQGGLEITIPGNARIATVFVGEGDNEDVYKLTLGAVDPVVSISGIRQRLLNLGYPITKGGSKFDDETAAAIAAFQEDHDLAVTGEIDEITKQMLFDKHHS